jgi:hypothetical protein
MITYPVSPASRWSVFQVSTSTIIGRNRTWPRADGEAIVGMDPDFVYLLQITDKQPDYDSRLYTMEAAETIDIPANEIRTSWVTVARPKEDILLSAANVESLSNSDILRPEDTQKKLLLFCGLANRLFEGMKLTESEEKLRAEIAAITAPMWDNDANLAKIKAALDADEPVDLDTGWKTSLATAKP